MMERKRHSDGPTGHLEQLRNLVDSFDEDYCAATESIKEQRMADEVQEMLLATLVNAKDLMAHVRTKDIGTLVRPETWAHAHEALVFYFEQHGYAAEAGDLAEGILAEILRRNDFETDKEVDVFKASYASARHVLRTAPRKEGRENGSIMGTEIPAAVVTAEGLLDVEPVHFLEEVLRVGKKKLHALDREVSQEATLTGSGASCTNRERVRLHRARKVLASLVGRRKA
jgi:hypothetical protein